MKRFFAILSLLFLGLSVMAQDVTLKVSGMLLTRYRYTANETPSNTLSIRTARVQFGGRVFDDFAYNLQFKMDGTANSINGPRLLEASVEWQKYKSFRIKVGQMKRGFGFETLMSPIDQGFYRQGMAIYKLAGYSDRVGEQSCTGRDFGVMVQGDLFELEDRNLAHYMVGIYNGQGINVPDLNESKDVIGGLWVSPVKDMRIGASGWLGRYGRKFEGDYAEVDRNRYALSFEYKPGDWTLRSEYVHSNGMAFKNPYGGNLDLDTDLGDKADAWYALMIAPLIPETFHAKLRYDVYRDNGAWNRAYNAYDFGLDWCFSYNLILSAVGTYINDRRLAADHHNFFMFDLQMSLRF